MNANLIAGPHLIGLVMLLAGLLTKYFPPKTINNLYGYRTTRSMKNQQNWDEANSYSANLMIKLGTGCILLGIVLVFLLPANNSWIMLPATLVSLVGIVFTLLKATESHLKKTFPND